MEVRLGRHASVEHAVAGVGAHLAGQVDGERLRHRHHRRVGGDDAGSHTYSIGKKAKRGFAVDQVVESARAHGQAGHDLARVEALARAGDDAALDQIDERLGDDVRVDAEVPPVAEEPQHLVGHASQADLQRGAVIDEARDVAGDALRRVADRFVQVLDDRLVHGYDLVEAVERHLALRAGPRHPRVDLGDDDARRATAARAMSTETPRLHMPRSSGGLACTSATSNASRPLAIRCGTSASAMGT